MTKRNHQQQPPRTPRARAAQAAPVPALPEVNPLDIDAPVTSPDAIAVASVDAAELVADIALPEIHIDQPKTNEEPSMADNTVNTAATAATDATNAAATAARTTAETATDAARQMADRFQSAMGDMGERARGAMERSQRVIGEMAELNRGNLQALVESGRAAAQGAQTLAQEAADYNRRNLEATVAAFRGFAEVRSPADLVQRQNELVRGAFDRAVAENARVTEQMLKIMGDVVQPLSNRVAVTSQTLTQAIAA